MAGLTGVDAKLGVAVFSKAVFCTAALGEGDAVVPTHPALGVGADVG